MVASAKDISDAWKGNSNLTYIDADFHDNARGKMYFIQRSSAYSFGMSSMTFENKSTVEDVFPGLTTCKSPDSMIVNGNYQLHAGKGNLFKIDNNGNANGNSLSLATFFNVNLPLLNFAY